MSKKSAKKDKMEKVHSLDEDLDSKDCFLCGDLADRGGSVFITKNIRLLLDIFPITRGHLLIAPINHKFSRERALAADYNSIYRILDILDSNGFFLFEHGDFGTRSVSCITHPHLHAIPKKDSPFGIEALIKKVADNLSGFYRVDNWWPRYEIINSGDYVGYYYLSDMGSNPTTIYVSKFQKRHMLRRILQINVDWKRVLNEDNNRELLLHNTNLLKSTLREKLGNASENAEGKIIAISGLSGTGKTTISDALAESLDGVVIHSGRYICSIALRLQQIGCEFTYENTLKLLREGDYVLLRELELTEEIRTIAAKLCLNRRIWARLMDEFWHMALAARAYKKFVIVEGRGFDESMFRKADHHIKLTAAANVRAQRKRQRQRKHNSIARNFTNHTLRDYLDQSRIVGSEKLNNKSILFDTNTYDVSDIVNIISEIIKSNEYKLNVKHFIK